MQIKLTTGEKIMIGRRREDMTQDDFAKSHNVTQTLVSRWESDVIEPPKQVARQFRYVRNLKAGERATILRRRINLSMEKAAKEFRCSRYHVIKMEHGRANADDYLKFIEAKAAQRAAG